VDDVSYPPGIGATPWSVPQPFVVDMSSARSLGYEPMTSYEEAVKTTSDWLIETSRQHDWQEVFPALASYPRNHFDYGAEDTFFARLGTSELSE
jgi:hypothetical protein